MDLPGNLGGNNPLTPWLNKLKAGVMARTLREGLGYKLRHTTSGVILEILPGNGSSTGLRSYRVKSANGDYLVCRTWDGTTEGTADVKVAKNFDSRQIASETLDGTAFTYAYSGAATVLNRLRTATATNISESQQVTPLWKVNGLIQVASINHSAVTVDSADLKLIEVSSRCWARI